MKNTDGATTALLVELTRLPDIIGLFIHSETDDILFHDLPEWCPADEMARAGMLLHELFTKKGILNRRGKNISIIFDGLLVIGVRLNQTNTLVCLCTSKIDTDFFASASQNIIEKLKNSPALSPEGGRSDSTADFTPFLNSMQNGQRPAPLTDEELNDLSVSPNLFEAVNHNLQQKTSDKPLPVANKKESDQNEDPDQLANMLLPIERTLTKVIGPASEIILADSLSKWKKDGKAIAQRTDELINIICSKIESSRQEDKFREILHNLKIHKKTNLLNIKGVEKAFARVIGPASSVVIAEIMKKWHPHKTSTAEEQLNEFIDLLCIELDDPQKEKKFRSTVKNLKLS